MTFWGFHIQAQGLRNKQRLLDYHRRAQPRWTLVLEGDGLALEIKAASPDTNVISRHYFADGTWYGALPQDYLDYLDRIQASPDLWNFVENESGINPRWNIELITLNAKRAKPYKLVILNLAVGNPPNPQEWTNPDVVELLKLCDQYREWCVIGLHEYFNAIVTSGFIGGAPNRAGVELDKPGVGENLIPKEAWPPKERKLTRWHMGRFAFMVNTCKALNINPPRVVLTEAGADDVSDIKVWSETLRKTPPYTSIRGWHSLWNQWEEWYPGQTPEQTYADMLQYAADVIYDGSIVEGGCIYCYATPDTQWLQFNIEGSEGLLSALEKAADMPKLIEKPANANSPQIVRIQTHAMNMRYGPGMTFKKLNGDASSAELQPDDKIIYYQPYTFVIDRQWAYTEVLTGKCAGQKGWISVTDLKAKPTKPIPPITIPENPPVIEPPTNGKSDETQTPLIQTFVIPMTITVKATSQEAAEAAATAAMSLARNGYNQFVQMDKLRNYLAANAIQDVQFVIQLQEIKS